MKTIMLWIAALLLSVAPLHAQDITGNWQGTLQAPQRPLRIVIKITSDGGTLKAVLYSIDQQSPPIGASAISVQGTTVKIAIAAMSATYEGKVNADGTAITGTFTQGAPMALTLARATGDTAWAIPEPPAAMKPMAATARPVFDVVTIKPSQTTAPAKVVTIRGRQVVMVNVAVNDILTLSYSLHPGQIVGAPAWFDSEKFDITGTPDVEGLPSTEQLRLLMHQLLADRFKLTFHRDTKELSVYALVVGPKGPSLTKSESTSTISGLMFRGLGALPARNATMGEFAAIMQSQVLDRPVVDRTGLNGRFDFTLTWTPDDSQFRSLGVRIPPPPADGSGPPGLFTAIQEQLGLKFETTRAPIEVIVIDQVERPSPN